MFSKKWSQKKVSFKNQCIFSTQEAPYGWVEVVNETLNKIEEIKNNERIFSKWCSCNFA